MKKFIVALAAMAMTAGMAAEAKQCPQQNRQCRQECTQQCPQCPQCPQKCDSVCATPCARQQCAFDNLNLTDAQKQQLKDLCAKQRQCKKDAKADRKAAKQERLNAIKGILTPEQYVTFLENHFLNGGGKFMPRAGKHGHAARHMNREGMRPECAKACPAAPVKAAKVVEPTKK